MKSILLIRHAKSSWDQSVKKDFDRPLNDRGLKDAPAMAKRLLERDIEINGFISSPALRALTTCKYFAKAYGKKETDIITYNDLYNARPQVFLKVIKNASEAFDNI